MKKILDVKFDPQTDDKVDAYTNCNINSLGMALRMSGDQYKNATDDYLYDLLKSPQAKKYAKKLIKNGVSWLQSYLDKDILKQAFCMLKWAARYVIGDGDTDSVKDYVDFFTTLPMSAMRYEISQGYPVVVSGTFRNMNNTKRYDHIILLNGFDMNGFYVKDPAGDILRNKNGDIDYNATYFDGSSGESHYPYEYLKKVLNGYSDTKWALCVHADKKQEIEIPLQYSVDFYMKI